MITARAADYPAAHKTQTARRRSFLISLPPQASLVTAPLPALAARTWVEALLEEVQPSSVDRPRLRHLADR